MLNRVYLSSEQLVAKLRQWYSYIQQGLIKAFSQNRWPKRFEKFRQRFSDVQQDLIKTYPQNNWHEKFEKFRQRFSDVNKA